VAALTTLLLAMAGSRLGRQEIGAAAFMMPAAYPVAAVPRSDRYLVPLSPDYAHAASAVVLDDGRIAAFWFSAHKETDASARLMTAVFDGQSWSPATMVTDGRQTGLEVGRYTKTVGNSVVLRRADGEYWLIYVTVGVGGWSASALNLKRSPDGLHWGAATRLPTSPFLNLSTLVKGQALQREDGLVALPAYQEFIGHYPEMLFLDAMGAIVGKERMAADGHCAIQPAAVPLGGGRALALLRNKGCAPRELYQTMTSDGGLTWSPVEGTGIANPDSPAALLRLADGRLLAIANDDPGKGYTLRMLVSADEGKSWTKGAALFEGAAKNTTYRYPLLLQDRDGRIHLIVTETIKWRERGLRHLILGAGDIPSAGGGDGH
jgi:predicted neuraminidase